MTRPSPTRATLTAKSVVSEASFLAIGPRSGQPADLVLEGAPPLRVVAEHVERRAGGGQENDVARHGPGPRLLDRLAQRRAGDHGNDAAERVLDLRPGFAD